MRKIKYIGIFFLTLIVLSNVPPINLFFKFFLDERHYQYSNVDGSFTFVEFKASDYKMMRRKFSGFKNENSQLKDTNIYRLFLKNPFTFWRWQNYFFDDRYSLPYKNWETILMFRKDTLHRTHWQDF